MSGLAKNMTLPEALGKPRGSSASDFSALSRRAAPLLGLALILLAMLWSLKHHEPAPAELFGRFHDDSILMSSGQALAEDRGYLLPSIPRTPVQTKYPILYPWLLSRVWKWNPSFPANLGAALGLSAVFACFALLASYFLLRSLGVGIGLALAITAYCGLHPAFLNHSARVLTDLPMMALTLAAAVAADRAFQVQGRLWPAAAAGILTVAAVLTRTIGLTIFVAVVAVGIWRKRYLDTLTFLVFSVPLMAAGMLWRGDNGSLRSWVEQGPAGFRQTWAFYTDYAGFWKLAVPDLRVLFEVAYQNLEVLLFHPANYFVSLPFAGSGSAVWIMLSVTISVGILAGLIRLARQGRWSVIHVVFLLQVPVILVWPHSYQIQRFLLPFLPLFCLGLWTEGRHLFGLVRRSLRPPPPPPPQA